MTESRRTCYCDGQSSLRREIIEPLRMEGSAEPEHSKILRRAAVQNLPANSCTTDL